MSICFQYSLVIGVSYKEESIVSNFPFHSVIWNIGEDNEEKKTNQRTVELSFGRKTHRHWNTRAFEQKIPTERYRAVFPRKCWSSSVPTCFHKEQRQMQIIGDGKAASFWVLFLMFHCRHLNRSFCNSFHVQYSITASNEDAIRASSSRTTNTCWAMQLIIIPHRYQDITLLKRLID